MDPRVVKTHAAVMRAATDLLVEGGPDALTVDAVVARSGVAKTTVYRHWATRDDLVLDVITSCAPMLVTPDPDAPFEQGVVALARQIMELMADPGWKRLAPALILLKAQQEEVAELDEAMKDRQSQVVREILQRGVTEGALRADVLDDPEMSGTLLIGPIVMAGLVDSVPLDETLVRRVVEQFLAAHRP